jgi:hypothetical protein
MEISIIFTHEEIVEIDSRLDKISQRFGKRRTLEELFFRWNRFITHIENVYNFTIDDYTNDLFIRNFFEIVITDCSTQLHEKLMSLLTPLDNRYICSTDSINEPLLPLLESDLGWWWYRIPKKHTDRFYLLD